MKLRLNGNIELNQGTSGVVLQIASVVILKTWLTEGEINYRMFSKTSRVTLLPSLATAYLFYDQPPQYESATIVDASRSLVNELKGVY